MSNHYGDRVRAVRAWVDRFRLLLSGAALVGDQFDTLFQVIAAQQRDIDQLEEEVARLRAGVCQESLGRTEP